MESSELGFGPPYDEAEERPRAAGALAEREALAIGEAVKRRIGRDLHDGLGQILVGAALLARSIEQRAPLSLQSELGRLVDTLNDATGRMQSIARGLAPIHVGELPLQRVLTNVWLALPLPPGAELEVRIAPVADELMESAKVELCLIAQEALQNALRHGHAKHLEVELRAHGGELTLTIDDDGSGIEPGPRAGLGLSSMRYRARVLGGTLSVGPRSSGGTRVRCVWLRP